MNNCWFHIDMDAFFASVEQLDNPDLRGKPIMVGSPPGHRGVVATCSYEARAFGVHSAMPSGKAQTLCPQGIFVPPRMKRYQELSERIMAIFQNFTPTMQQVSIDEAYLDMHGTERLLGKPQQVAMNIKQAVAQATGLSLSIGIGSNKLIAKIASGFQKPDGLTIIDAGKEAAFVASLPLAKLWGIGSKTRERLEIMGIRDCKTLQSFSLEKLAIMFGTAGGTFMYKASQGQDPGMYDGEPEHHSISNETTFETDIDKREILEEQLFLLAHGLVFRLLKEQATSSTLALKIRTAGFETFHCQKTLSQPILSIEDTFGLAKLLLTKRWDGHQPLRLIGLGFHNVQSTETRQHELFEISDAKRNAVEQAVVQLKGKYASTFLSKARVLKNKP